MNFPILQLWHTHLSWTGAWFISPLWRSIWARAVTCHPYGCAPRFPEPRPGRWLCYCHLAADMTCATRRAIKLLRCHTTWSLTLATGCASCSCQTRKIQGVPGNSSRPFLPALPGADARMGWDVPGSCYCLRKLYSCEVALEESVWPAGITGTRNVSVKNLRHLREVPLDKWNLTQSFLVPAW